MSLHRLKENQLREQIIELINNEFGQLSNPSILKVLTQITRHFDSSLEMSSSSQEVDSNIVLKDAGEESSFGVVDAGSTIRLIAEDDKHISDLLHQIVSVGAVLIQVGRAVQLNDLIALDIALLPLSFGVNFVGRVVSISDVGTAIEVSQITKEDRAALEKLYQQFKDKPQPKSEGSLSQDSSDASDDSFLSGVRLAGRGAQLSNFKRQSNEPRFAIKRQVSMTIPDDGMVRELTRHRVRIPMTGETYGPLTSFARPVEKPERIENLAKDRILDILLQQSGSDFSGVVEIIRGENTSYQLQFDTGFLTQILCAPRKSEFELGPMLLAAKKLDKTQLDMAAAHADDQKFPLEHALLDLDIMPSEQLRNTLAGRLTFVLRDIVKLNTGEVRIFEADAMTPGFLPNPPLRVHLAVERPIFEALFESLRNLSANERTTRAHSELDAYPEILDQDRARLEHTTSDTRHLRFLQNIVTGRRRLREVFTESALSGPDTFALVFALHRMGLVRFDRSLHHTVVRERFRENVTVKHLSVHKASYFEVLNVHWSSYDDVVQRAYDELCQQFDPNAMPDSMESEVYTRVREIRERVDLAYRSLAKRPQRHAYRVRIMPEYKLTHAVPLFLKQCELAEKRKQPNDAIDALKRVLEIAPEHENAKKWQDHLLLLERSGGVGNVDSSFM